jgi:predicted kinase
MSLLFITGTAPKETRYAYVSALTARIPNSIYLDLNNMHTVFKELEASDFNEDFSYAQRLGNPAQEVVLGLAHDNIPLHKIAIIEGNFDFALVAKYINARFPTLLESGIYAINLTNASAPLPATENMVSLITLTKGKVLTLNPDAEIKANSIAVLTMLTIAPSYSKARAGKLVMGAGLAGGGKTTHLHQATAEINTSVYIDKDTIAVDLLASVAQSMPGPYYDKYVKAQSYQAVFTFAADNLKLNKTTILDGCFGDRLTGSLISNHLATSPYKTLLMYFHCTGPTQLARIIQRNFQRDIEKLKDMKSDRQNALKKHLKEFSQIDPASTILYLDTESNAALTANVRRIIHYVTSAHVHPLRMLGRSIPFDDKSCEITVEQAQGGLADFMQWLQQTVSNDQQLQSKATAGSRANNSFNELATNRNSIWHSSFKLPAGNAHLWPHMPIVPEAGQPDNYRHLQRRN